MQAHDASTLRQQTGQGSGLSSGNQEALKEEIQQLLKEVSGQLQQIQAQLANAKNQPHSEAGTGSDSNIYEAPMSLDHNPGAPVPIQLKTDTAETKVDRSGGGVGKPSGDVSSATPHTRAEEAQLSDQPLEESPTNRQAIPPEYRGVFDQLHKQSPPPNAQTSETTR